MVTLVEIEDSDFDWFLGGETSRTGLTLPPGGVEHPVVLEIVRKMTKDLHADGCHASWMIVSGGEVVGLCSFRRSPKAGLVEIGYGISESRRGRGFATGAVEAIVRIVQKDPTVQTLTAETAVSNPTSGRVLEKNGFSSVGKRIDPEDGEVILWSRKIDLEL